MATTKLCLFCRQPLKRVPSFDMERYLMDGTKVRTGNSYIHMGPDVAQACRLIRRTV